MTRLGPGRRGLAVGRPPRYDGGPAGLGPGGGPSGATRAGFRRAYLGWIRTSVRSLLGSGAGCRCARTAGVCRELLAVEPALYTFAAVEGVEPTNNAAERALRHAVCWRKTSYGTDSAGGSRFVERVLTVVATCRQQGRDVLAFLTDAIQAARTGTAPPSLIPVHASTP